MTDIIAYLIVGLIVVLAFAVMCYPGGHDDE